MNNPTVSRISYAVLVILNFVISATILEIGKGTVPFPSSLTWAVPIIVAALTGVTLFLPKYGNEPLAEQAHALSKRGVTKQRMAVVDRWEHDEEIRRAERRGIEQARAHQTPLPPLQRLEGK